MNFKFSNLLFLIVILAAYTGCTETDNSARVPGGNDTDTNNSSDTDTDSDTDSDTDTDSDSDSDSDGDTDQQITCDMAKEHHTYIGCDFWPTITYNMVWFNQAASAGFQFAVVVANDLSDTATINVEGGALTSSIQETIPPGEVKAIKLPWVQGLKGTTFNAANTSGNRVTTSVLAAKGAYHLTSDIPVTAWQFSPLEYELTPFPAGCIDTLTDAAHCYSVTNDAALLMPSTAMTGAYRVFTFGGTNSGSFGDAPGAIAITAVEDNTLVKVDLKGDIVAGSGVTAATAGTVVEYTLQSGDVVQLLGAPGAYDGQAHSDLTGSLVSALDANDQGTSEKPNYKPVQVIGLSPIADLTPATQVSYADHMEETVLPAEVLGNKYIVTAPTGKGGSPVEYRARIIGSTDGTTLTYTGTTPPGAPTTLGAGQWTDVTTTSSFIVASQDNAHPFIVAVFIQGDEPAVSMMVTPEQFRTNYSFLAPVSYQTNYCDIIMPEGATVTLDGAPLAGSNTPIADGWSVQRVALNTATGGKHKLESDKPVGLQVMGYGWATSYFYPGGLDLEVISEPPPIIIID